MSNKNFRLNKTTKTLGSLFPALLLFTPAVAFASTIDQSTSIPQNFSTDAEYVINKDVTITSSGNEAAVSVTGFNVKTVTNQGNISGMENGLEINTRAQHVIINNDLNANITSTTGNAINIESMLGDLNNEGNISGSENGIFVSESSSAININNKSSGVIKGKTGINAQTGAGINNSGTISGTSDNGITVSEGNSKITNTGTVQGAQNGINVTDTAKVDIINNGSIGGGGTAITFASSKNNTLVLDTGSSLKGDVISSISKGNTITLAGTGTEDSNFVGLSEGDGFASLEMDGESWALSGNIDIIGSGNSLLVNSGDLILSGNVSNAGTTLVAKDASLQLGDGTKTATLSGGLTNNGTLIFNQGSNTAFATGITGSGNVEKVDSNTLTLTGKNT